MEGGGGGGECSVGAHAVMNDTDFDALNRSID